MRDRLLPLFGAALVFITMVIRTLPLAGETMFMREGLVPAIRIGSDIRIKPYGIFKAVSMMRWHATSGASELPIEAGTIFSPARSYTG